jgi:hypothetical protein
MEAHYLGIQSGKYDEAKLKIIEMLNLDDPELQTEEQNLVAWMFEGYIQHYGTDPEWEIKAVEYANQFWLPAPSGNRSDFRLKLKIDLVVKIQGRLWIVDHKSCKNLPNDKMLELNDQFGLYTWALRKLGLKIHGSIHNACRTFRGIHEDEDPASLDARFKRTLMYRTDRELDMIADEAYRTAKRAWTTPLGEAERNTNEDTCRWRCDYTEACLMSRKGGDLVHMLTAQGFEVNKERH